MSVKLNDGERLILFMLGEIYRHLKIDSEIDPDFIMKAVGSGRDWALASKYSGLFPSKADDPTEVHETHEILTMFRVLSSSFERLNTVDKTRVDNEVPPFSGSDLKFKGFDGNHDPHYGIANFMVADLGLYAELNGIVINSHSSVLEVYRRMLKAYKPLTLFSIDGLTADQLIIVLQSRLYQG